MRRPIARRADHGVGVEAARGAGRTPLLLLLLGEQVELVNVLVVQWIVTVTGGGGLYDSLTEVVSLITR